MKKIRVLVVDDVAFLRKIICTRLAQEKDIEVVGEASDAFVASSLIPQLQPDVMTLDVQMPRMDGVEFLHQLLPQYPLPVVMLSHFTQADAQATISALAAGAVDCVGKPTRVHDPNAQKAMLDELITKVRLASKANVKGIHRKSTASERQRCVQAPQQLKKLQQKVLVIGASTGGTEAIDLVIPRLTPNGFAVLFVQHMPETFVPQFAKRLNDKSRMEVRLAEDNAEIVSGTVLVAPGDKHMEVAQAAGGKFKVALNVGEPVLGFRPSVDVLMCSAAKHLKARAVGVVLTGMGTDGGAGLLAMRQAGAKCMAQDEATSIVYGMPKAAYDNGAAQKVCAIEDMSTILEEWGAE